MRVVAITNQKGGTAKTTTAVSLAAALAEAGRRVLVIDFDPQANASSWLGVADGGRGLVDALGDKARIDHLITDTSAPGVQLVPSSTWMIGAERVLAGEPGAEMILRRAVEQLPNRWDYVLIDCQPSLGYLAVSALAAGDEVLVPVELQAMPLVGLAALTQTIERVRDRLNPGLKISAILACRVKRTSLAREVRDRLKTHFNGTVMETGIRENTKLAEAPSHHLPITLYAPSSSGAEDYRAAAAELDRRRPSLKRS
ncbi:ParA family protein [bacterium]|nr:MAG: ParA family protein [bacterium]